MDDYSIFGYYQEDVPIAAVGFRLQFDLCHGKHIYIDDLITDENQRSKGLGAKLLKFIEKYAKEIGCTGIRLSSGVDRVQAHKFYEKHNYRPKSLAFKKIF